MYLFQFIVNIKKLNLSDDKYLVSLDKLRSSEGLNVRVIPESGFGSMRITPC